MKIGTVLKHLWRLLARQQQHGPDEHFTEGNALFAGVGATNVTRAEAKTESVTNINGVSRNEQLRLDPLISSLINIDVGDIQVRKEEQMFLVSMRIMRMLRCIKKALEELRRRIGQERQGDRNEDHNRHPLSGLIPSMVDNLDESVRELEQSLKCSIMQQGTSQTYYSIRHFITLS
jgi:hypothetical protein